MAKVDLLTAARVKNEVRPGDYFDGRGLYLQVRSESSKSWLLKYMLNKRAREMGLGSAFDIGLAKARELRDRYREMLAQGVDPIETKAAEQAAKAAEQARAITFEAAAKRHIASKKHGWKNAKHADQWEATLKTYAYPVIGKLPVQSVDTDLVMKILDPIWATKTETASRVRGRIESVLDGAKARKEYVGENPARWAGHLKELLPAPKKVRKPKNFPSLPYAQVPAFMKALRSRDGIAAKALEFHILTAARSGNAVTARWDQMDEETKTWNVAGEDMKVDADHRVPLSDAAWAVLEEMKKVRSGDYVFSIDGKNPLSDAAMGAVIDRMNRPKPLWLDPKQGDRPVVPHGFRSSFRTWGGEETHFPRELLEKALAHTVGDETERSYARGDLFKKRRDLMEAWAAYVVPDQIVSGKVRRLHA